MNGPAAAAIQDDEIYTAGIIVSVPGIIMFAGGKYAFGQEGNLFTLNIPDGQTDMVFSGEGEADVQLLIEGIGINGCEIPLPGKRMFLHTGEIDPGDEPDGSVAFISINIEVVAVIAGGISMEDNSHFNGLSVFHSKDSGVDLIGLIGPFHRVDFQRFRFVIGAIEV